MDCLTFHYDAARTGLGEGLPAGTPWRALPQVALGSPVRGAALLVRGWTFHRGPHAGSTLDVVVVAASNNEVVAYSEADLYAGRSTPLWGPLNLGPAVMLTTSNIPPPIGICSTPVLDPANARLFVMSAQPDGSGRAQYHAYALDLDSGTIIQSAQLADSGGAGRPTFVPNAVDQRGALNLVNGRVYATFADFQYDDSTDYGEMHGWVVGCNANNLFDQWYWPSTQNVQGGGIWGPGGAAAAPDGTLYVATGNGYISDPNYWTTHPHPGDYGDYFQGVVKLGVVPSGWSGSLAVQGWYQPSDAENQNDNDWDFGSSSPLVLPTINGWQLVLVSAKVGIYLLNRNAAGTNQLGGWSGELDKKMHVFGEESHCAPAYWQSPAGDHYVYVTGGGGPSIICYRVDTTLTGAHLTEVWRSNVASNDAAGSPTVAHYGSPDGAMVWFVATNPAPPASAQGGRLLAFNALNGSSVYDSDAVAADKLGLVPNYPPVTGAGRLVLVGTNTGLAVYAPPHKHKPEIKEIKDALKPEIKEFKEKEFKEREKLILEVPKLKDAEGDPGWMQPGDPYALVRELAAEVAQLREELRSFIGPAERPAVGPPEAGQAADETPQGT
jgi:hypothetical protein